jgi:hypothetical protein
MGTDVTRVRVSDTIYSWTSGISKIDNFPIEGIVSLDFSQKRERKVVYGQRGDGRPLGKTSGKYTAEPFTIKVLRDTADAITDYLAVKGIGSHGDAKFNFMLQVSETPDALLIPVIIRASSCHITAEKDGNEEGFDELLTEFEITPLQMTKNGKALWSVQRSLAQP